jgi:hypothetical protein
VAVEDNEHLAIEREVGARQLVTGVSMWKRIGRKKSEPLERDQDWFERTVAETKSNLEKGPAGTARGTGLGRSGRECPAEWLMSCRAMGSSFVALLHFNGFRT